MSVMSETSLFPQRVVSTSHLKTMENRAFVSNTGHFDKEIDFAGSDGLEGLQVDYIRPQKIVPSSVGLWNPFRLPCWPRCDRAILGSTVDTCASVPEARL